MTRVGASHLQERLAERKRAQPKPETNLQGPADALGDREVSDLTRVHLGKQVGVERCGSTVLPPHVAPLVELLYVTADVCPDGPRCPSMLGARGLHVRSIPRLDELRLGSSAREYPWRVAGFNLPKRAAFVGKHDTNFVQKVRK